MGDFFEIVWLTTERAFVVLGNITGREVVRELDAAECERVLAFNEGLDQESQKFLRTLVGAEGQS